MRGLVASRASYRRAGNTQAGVDCANMRKNSKPVYNNYRHGALPDMHTEKAYDVYRRALSGEPGVITEFLAYFNKGMIRELGWYQGCVS